MKFDNTPQKNNAWTGRVRSRRFLTNRLNPITTFWVVCFAVLLSATDSWANTVAKISRSKSLVLVESSEKVQKGDTACILNKSGKEVVCGEITRVQKGKFILTVADKSLLAKVRKGQSVSLGGSSTADNKNPIVIRVSYNGTLMGPTSYGKAGYVAPANPSSPASQALWESGGTENKAFLGATLGASIPIGSFAINPGFRWRNYLSSTLATDYDPVVKTRYAEINQSMSAIGLWIDATVFRVSSLSIDAGIDMEMSTLALKANLIDEKAGTSGDLTSATSKLNVISLRTGIDFDLLVLGPAGLTFGLDLLIPLVEMGRNFSSSHDGDGFAANNTDVAKDLQAAMAHKKSGFAFDFSLGLAVGF